MKFSNMLEGYWLARRNKLAKTTQGNYQYIFDRFIQFIGDIEFVTITTVDVHTFLNELQDGGQSGASVASYWATLSSLWTWAESEMGCEHIMRGRVAIPKIEEKQPEPFTQDEIKRLLKAAEFSAEWVTPTGKRVRSERPSAVRDRAIILTLLDTGVRVSELCNLTVEDYDSERGRLFVRSGKGDKSRYVYAGRRAQMSIWRYLNGRKTGWVFLTRSDYQMERNNVRHMLKRIGAAGGVDNVYPHRFRHTFAITFLRNGGNVFILKELMGHSKLETTMRYVNLAGQDLQEAQRRSSPADNWRL